MSEHFHAIVWIDHREARVFHFNVAEVDHLVIHANSPTRQVHHKANSIGSGHADDDHSFLRSIANAVADSGAVLITGPADAKTQLAKHIEQHMPKLAAKIVGVEALDHPSDGELIAHARRHFAFDHQMLLRAH